MVSSRFTHAAACVIISLFHLLLWLTNLPCMGISFFVNLLPYSQVVLVIKNPPTNEGVIRDASSITGVRKIPLRRAWQPTLVFLPGESHGQRILMGYSPLGLKEPDMTSNLTQHTHIHQIMDNWVIFTFLAVMNKMLLYHSFTGI